MKEDLRLLLLYLYQPRGSTIAKRASLYAISLSEFSVLLSHFVLDFLNPEGTGIIAW